MQGTHIDVGIHNTFLWMFNVNFRGVLVVRYSRKCHLLSNRLAKNTFMLGEQRIWIPNILFFILVRTRKKVRHTDSTEMKPQRLFEGSSTNPSIAPVNRQKNTVMQPQRLFEDDTTNSSHTSINKQKKSLTEITLGHMERRAEQFAYSLGNDHERKPETSALSNFRPVTDPTVGISNKSRKREIKEGHHRRSKNNLTVMNEGQRATTSRNADRVTGYKPIINSRDSNISETIYDVGTTHYRIKRKSTELTEYETSDDADSVTSRRQNDSGANWAKYNSTIASSPMKSKFDSSYIQRSTSDHIGARKNDFNIEKHNIAHPATLFESGLSFNTKNTDDLVASRTNPYVVRNNSALTRPSRRLESISSPLVRNSDSFVNSRRNDSAIIRDHMIRPSNQIESGSSCALRSDGVVGVRKDYSDTTNTTLTRRSVRSKLMSSSMLSGSNLVSTEKNYLDPTMYNDNSVHSLTRIKSDSTKGNRDLVNARRHHSNARRNVNQFMMRPELDSVSALNNYADDATYYTTNTSRNITSLNKRDTNLGYLRTGSVLSSARNNGKAAASRDSTTTKSKYSTALGNFDMYDQRNQMFTVVGKELDRIMNAQFPTPSFKPLNLSVSSDDSTSDGEKRKSFESGKEHSKKHGLFTSDGRSAITKHPEVKKELCVRNKILFSKLKDSSSDVDNGTRYQATIDQSVIIESNINNGGLRTMPATSRAGYDGIHRKTNLDRTHVSASIDGIRNYDNSTKPSYTKVSATANSSKMILKQEKTKRAQEYVNTLREIPDCSSETNSPEFRVPAVPAMLRRGTAKTSSSDATLFTSNWKKWKN